MNARVPPFFENGTNVERKKQPDKTGVVSGSWWDEQTSTWMYDVQFGRRLVSLPEAALTELKAIVSPFDCLMERRVSGRAHFQHTMTLCRLRRPPSRIAYAFSTARTQFYPHQFKPLLKFFDHPGRRLLLADEVGLGKTIEAGYILRELQARTTICRVLIVVPARICVKWQKELNTRFHEHFEIVRKAHILPMLRLFETGIEPPDFKWIVSLESVRDREVLEVLQRIEDTPLPLDLLISDEAHGLRNSATNQHRAFRRLRAGADSVLLVTATPVQNKIDDLSNLLSLLDHSAFGNRKLFEQQLSCSAVVKKAEAAISQSPPDCEAALALLGKMMADGQASRVVGHELLDSVLSRLRSKPDSDELPELQADLAALAPLSTIVCRTRKAEAIPDRPQRVATWERVELTELEQQIHDLVLGVVDLGTQSSQWGAQRRSLMTYQMLASSIPGAVSYFADKISKSVKVNANKELEEQYGEEEVDEGGTDEVYEAQTDNILARIVDLWTASKLRDSKFEKLRSVLEQVWLEDERGGHRRRKIVVFSFFKRTLDHLQRELTELGIRNRRVHGDVNMQQRADWIEEFLGSTTVNVLLSSEVSAESIDLQAASVLVNYDLPWNPMRVEQRIGRLDRIGQASRRIWIHNLITADTVEERVLKVLLDKIDIFTESIGELEPIIGEEFGKLASKAMARDLSPQELAKLVEERGQILRQTVSGAKKIIGKVDQLLAADQALTDEVHAVLRERQLPSEHELLSFLNRFLKHHYDGLQLPDSLATGHCVVELHGRLGLDIQMRADQLGREAALFGRKIASGPLDMTLARDVAFRRPSVELIHIGHPLVRYAVGIVEEKPPRETAFCLSLPGCDDVKPGWYGFLFSLVEVKGFVDRMRLVPVFAPIEGSGGVVSEEHVAMSLMLQLLEGARDIVMPTIDSSALSVVLDDVRNETSRLARAWSDRERRRQREVYLRQKQAQLFEVEQLIQRRTKALNTAKERGRDPRVLRLNEKGLENLRLKHKRISENKQLEPELEVESQVVCVGLVCIGGKEDD